MGDGSKILKPLGEQLIIKPVLRSPKQGSLYLPGEVKTQEALVIEVSDEIAETVKAGDRIIYDHLFGILLSYENYEHCLLYPLKGVLGIIEPDDEISV